MFHVTPLERYVTEEGCLVETRRQQNAHGEAFEHVVLSTPDPQPTEELSDAHDQ